MNNRKYGFEPTQKPHIDNPGQMAEELARLRARHAELMNERRTRSAANLRSALEGRVSAQAVDALVELAEEMDRAMGAQPLAIEGRLFTAAAGQRFEGSAFEVLADIFSLCPVRYGVDSPSLRPLKPGAEAAADAFRKF